MTRGKIDFFRQDGVKVTAYTYHDGHSRETIESLLELPRLLVERWKVFEGFQNLQSRSSYWGLVGTHHSISLLKEKDRSLKETLGTLDRILPDMSRPEVSNLANWFCGVHFDRWMILPEDEISEGEPDITFTEIDEGVYKIVCNHYPFEKVFNWRFELIMALRIYNNFDYIAYENLLEGAQ